MDLYKGRIKEEPVKIPYARVSYVDFNQNGKRDLGEELKYNQKAEQLLKHIVFRENDLVQLEKIHRIISLENKRTQQFMNQIESQIIARAALLASDTNPKEIGLYLQKLEAIYQGYQTHLATKNLKPTNSRQQIRYFKEYLWKNGHSRNEESIHRFNLVIDNQLEYFVKRNIKVGNCSGFVNLEGTLFIRNGNEVKVVTIPGHIFLIVDDEVVETTNYSGTNSYKFQPHQVRSAFEMVHTAVNNTWSEYDRKKNHPKTIEFLQKAITLSPENVDHYNSIGETYLEMNRYDDAIKWHEKGIIINPFHAINLHNLGVAYVKKNDYQKAIKYIEFAIQVNPNEAEYYSTLGYAYENTNQFQEAYNNYHRALKINPKLETAINHMNRFKQKVKIVKR